MSQEPKPCPRCGRHAGPTNRDRESFEHATGHMSAHVFKHHPLLGLLGLGTLGISKLLPRQYRCSGCSHTFSA